MGFRHTLRDDKLYFYERRDIMEQRHNYLKKIRQYRREDRPIVYLDETWANSHMAPERLWLDEQGRGGWKRPSGKGQRLIILHAGSETGWTPNADLVFRSKKNSTDYHDEMNSEHFLEWFQKLLVNIQPGSVIVLDNAPYHNSVVEKVPTKSSRKKEMQEWLTRKRIPFSDKDLKKDLFAKIQLSVPNRKLYATNEAAKACGHIVLRSPVAHCELNPIELVWADVKRYLKVHNKTFKLADLEQLVPDAFQSVTPEMWAKHCQHVQEEEERFWEKDGLQEESVEEYIIELGTEDDDDDIEVRDIEFEGEGEDSDGEQDECEPVMDENDRELLRSDAVSDA
ncbi:uncharacterized protein LOC134195205 [Corticium candelabrum]|uniref:uncharacterized protein LOC134195205 n=1 Tax=Corticium candelabrum TaxID=121492 RepID=UPI002E2598A6|nr:uncharacterized protein LOC134195205 [Corticium candelabrum]